MMLKKKYSDSFGVNLFLLVMLIIAMLSSFVRIYFDLTFIAIFFFFLILISYNLLKSTYQILCSNELIEFRTNVFSKFKKHSYENITFKKVNYLYKKENKEKIILYLGNQSVTIGQEENGYKELLEKLSHSSKEINTKNYDFKFIIISLLAILIITPIILFTRINYNLKNIENDFSIEKEGYITIYGIMINKEYGGKGSSGFKRIIVTPFNTFKFIPNSNRFDVDNFYKNFKDGDSVKIYISPNEDKKKIAKKDSLTFHDKYFSYNYITFYGIENSKYKFTPKK